MADGKTTFVIFFFLSENMRISEKKYGLSKKKKSEIDLIPELLKNRVIQCQEWVLDTLPVLFQKQKCIAYWPNPVINHMENLQTGAQDFEQVHTKVLPSTWGKENKK